MFSSFAAVTLNNFEGTVIAPKARIDAGGWGKTFKGQFVGKDVVFHPDCNVTFIPFEF